MFEKVLLRIYKSRKVYKLIWYDSTKFPKNFRTRTLKIFPKN